MPTISLIRSHLFESIGKEFTDEEFDELCFEFGVEVDEIVTEMVDFTATNVQEEHIIYKIDIPANRYDILCLEGFSRAIRIFLGLQKTPTIKHNNNLQTKQKMIIEKSTNAIRPFASCAILRGLKFDAKRYKSFIDLQDKLHQNICRRRKYVAIGTHDLNTITGPFYYKALPPKDINFVPLTDTNNKSFMAKDLLDSYRNDPTFKHLKPFTDLIYNSPVYPIIYDSKDTVLSMPPIINSRHSRITLDTTDVFIECTGIDITKTNIVLDTMVAMFSEYCEEPFIVEPVDVVYEDPVNASKSGLTPLLSTRTCDANLKEINGTIGVDLKADEVCRLCEKMQLGPASFIESENIIRVNVPPTRSDVLHAVDVIEDVAIAYGYNNIVQQVPKTNTVGKPLEINQFADLLRQEIGRAGYVEMLTHGLCSTAENFTNLRREIGPAVSLSNPANMEYEVVRTTLIPGALKTLCYNRNLSHKEGVQLFEISDVVFPCENEVGAKNVRNLVGLHAAHASSFETIHGLLDRIMTCAQIQPDNEYAMNSLSKDEIAAKKRVSREDIIYKVVAGEDPTFFPGMAADILLKKGDEESKIGSMGVIHPDVLANFDIIYPTTVLEIDLDALL